MAQIANVTSFSGANGTELTVSNSGWTTSTTSPFSTGDLTVYSSKLVGGAGQISKGYLRTETPGSANQTVRVGCNSIGLAQTDNSLLCLARVNGNNFIAAQYLSNASGTINLRKCIGGTLTTVTSVTGVGSVQDVVKNLELVVSGQSPNISCIINFDGVQRISQTLTESALDAVGQVGFCVRNFSSVSESTGERFTSFYAEDDSSAGSTVTITGTTSLPAFSGSAQVVPETSITVTTALPAFSGGASTGSASATVTATTSLPSFSGSVTGDTNSGVLTLPVLKNNTGTVLANETGATVHVYAVSTGNKVVTKTGQTTNASGVMTVTDALIVGGTQYRVVVVLGSGAEGLDKVTAS